MLMSEAPRGERRFGERASSKRFGFLFCPEPGAVCGSRTRKRSGRCRGGPLVGRASWRHRERSAAPVIAEELFAGHVLIGLCSSNWLVEGFEVEG